MNDVQKGAVLFLFLIVLAVIAIGSAASHIDLSAPILTERNPDGSTDAWYLGNAANERSHQ